ncbi:MAG: aminodeoxychorismate/anthranilate synthase component II [Bacteroidetes bacterium GWF2_42_66]|nr:MAG: aminodeoxychorismate/anthranilate synthase component II [Bacteroidetes bacterium GWA2_42_15]OFX99261.1 MAG: aminodeoxychorismate/anthranilate synthase component II [Bacteroidetes bacterium GWE2_42_39]OFY40658.1 MAG: aminodeoxychorismate/anthranilate synthase component II [Bacteroidetes bacterium GWF2_42_66]
MDFKSPLLGRGKGEAVVIIDNYDSFTYNLVHAIKKISGLPVDVIRNDELELSDLEKYDKIVLSPGPGLPEEAGFLLDIIREYAPTKSILGVCLGHQAIGEVFGGKLKNMNKVLHGVATPITVTENKTHLFDGLPETFAAGRYHSWIVSSENLPDCFEVTSYDNEGMIMSMQHKQYNVQGVQFHPESVLTPMGERIIENWLKAFPTPPKERF